MKTTISPKRELKKKILKSSTNFTEKWKATQKIWTFYLPSILSSSWKIWKSSEKEENNIFNEKMKNNLKWQEIAISIHELNLYYIGDLIFRSWDERNIGFVGFLWDERKTN